MTAYAMHAHISDTTHYASCAKHAWELTSVTTKAKARAVPHGWHAPAAPPVCPPSSWEVWRCVVADLWRNKM